MATKISGELHLAADPATVYAMVTNPDYVQEKNERTGGEEVKVNVEDRGADGAYIEVSRVLPAEIPSFAQKFVGEKIQTLQKDTWGPANADGSYDGSTDVSFGKAPMSLKGTFRIEAEGDGSVLYVKAEAKASVPLVGGKLEGVLREQFERAVRKEQEVASEWLTR